jgi:hypothetical protein
MMENPWKHLPLHEPYVLDMDRAIIERYNANFKSEDETYIHTELLPEPFYGNPQAPVMLLSLNPSYAKDVDARFYRQNADACRLNLKHAPQKYPFYLLNPAYKDYEGHDWWYKRLGALIKDTDHKRVTENVCCVEFFPYHSRRFGAHRLALPSSHYRHELVLQAIAEQRLIVIMRSVNHWKGAIPELKTYSNVCTLLNSQSTYVSPGNMPDGWYERLKNAI